MIQPNTLCKHNKNTFSHLIYIFFNSTGKIWLPEQMMNKQQLGLSLRERSGSNPLPTSVELLAWQASHFPSHVRGSTEELHVNFELKMWKPSENPLKQVFILRTSVILQAQKQWCDGFKVSWWIWPVVPLLRQKRITIEIKDPARCPCVGHRADAWHNRVPSAFSFH